MKGNRQSPIADSKAGKTWLSHTCPACGAKGGAYLAHYGVMRCACNYFTWALQPRRDGPLVLFAHPGFYPSQRETAAAVVSPRARGTIVDRSLSEPVCSDRAREAFALEGA